jgi:hypothetical protein
VSISPDWRGQAGMPCYEYIVLVTNTDLTLSAVAHAYRDRADCENVCDEIKNQWGRAGTGQNKNTSLARSARELLFLW